MYFGLHQMIFFFNVLFSHEYVMKDNLFDVYTKSVYICICKFVSKHSRLVTRNKGIKKSSDKSLQGGLFVIL